MEVDISAKSGAAQTMSETSITGRPYVAGDKGLFHVDRKPLYNPPTTAPTLDWSCSHTLCSANHVPGTTARSRGASGFAGLMSSSFCRHVSQTIKGRRLTLHFATVQKKNLE